MTKMQSKATTFFSHFTLVKVFVLCPSMVENLVDFVGHEAAVLMKRRVVGDRANRPLY